jgi:hypothetical protein
MNQANDALDLFVRLDHPTARVVSPPSLPYPRTDKERTACGTRGTTSRHPLSTNSFFQVPGDSCTTHPLCLPSTLRLDRPGWLLHTLRYIQISVAVCLAGAAHLYCGDGERAGHGTWASPGAGAADSETRRSRRSPHPSCIHPCPQVFLVRLRHAPRHRYQHSHRADHAIRLSPPSSPIPHTPISCARGADLCTARR